MLAEESWLIVVNAVVAAVLVNSGVVKLVSPAPLRRALREVAPVAGGRVTDTAVRAAASLELLAAGGLLAAATRVPAAVVIAGLGASFALLGAIGLARGSTTACGCFGRSSNQPLGLTNILVGLALLAVLPLNGLAVDASEPAVVVLLAALGTLLLCLWLNRDLLRQLLSLRRAGTS